MAAGLFGKGLSFLKNLLIYGFLILQMAQGRMSVAEFLIYTGLVSGFDTWLTAFFSALQEFFHHHITIGKYRAFEDAVAVGRREKWGNAVPERGGQTHEIRLSRSVASSSAQDTFSRREKEKVNTS